MVATKSRESWNLNRLLLFVAVACAAASAVFMGEPGVVAPFALGIVATIVLAFWQRSWLYLVAGIGLAGFPAMVLFVGGAYEGVLHPAGGREYVALALWLAVVVFALLGGIAGFVQGRKNAQPPLTMSSPQAAIALLLVGLFAGGFANAALATDDMVAFVTKPASNVVADETVIVVASDFAFSPREVNIPVGKLVALQVKNDDAAVHTFTYMLDGEERTTPLPAESEVTILLRFDEPQQIHFWCAPHSQGESDMEMDAMWGTLVVA